MNMNVPGFSHTEDAQKRDAVLHSPLEKVLEQDGMNLLTPTGVKRRARRIKNTRVQKRTSLFRFRSVPGMDVEAMAEALDQEVVACMVTRHEPPKAESVRVRFAAHDRSPYVISLRECVMRQVEDRVSVDDQMAFSQAHPNAKRIAPGALSAQTLRSHVQPWMVKRQSDSGKQSGFGAGIHRLKKNIKRFFAKEKKVFIKKEAQFEQELTLGIGEALHDPNIARVSFAKAVAGFLGIAFIMTLPAQALVVYRHVTQEKQSVALQGAEAMQALEQVSAATDMSVSVDQLALASEKFRSARDLLDQSRTMAVSAAAVMPREYRSARALLEIGDKMSEAGHILAVGLSKVFEDPSRTLIDRIAVLGTYARGVTPLLTDAEAAARRIDLDTIPEEYRGRVSDLPSHISQAKEMVRELALVSDAMTVFLGKDHLRNYLLVFQNHTERRPSGGFMGSVAEICFDRGNIQSIYVPPGGTYDLKGQLTRRVQSPLPMQLINPLWQFQDANWFADFEKSANKINWFWSNAGQPTLDGIVAVNATFMEKLLAITGPVNLLEYGKTINAENFLAETQKAVELEYDKQANTPKKFIGDLFDEMLEQTKTLSQAQWIELASQVSLALDTKEIQIAMFDEDEEELIKRFSWSGNLQAVPGDSLAIIGANIAGQKTDGVIDEQVYHETAIDAQGRMMDTVRLVRTHNGVKGQLFSGVRNVQYVRFYVPKGAELVSANGFEPPPLSLFKDPLESDGKDPDLLAIEETAKPGIGSVWQALEDDFTVFGGWIQLDPGRTQEVTLAYELPFTAKDVLASMNEDRVETAAESTARGAYMMLFTSQSGAPRKLTHTLTVDPAWKIIWSRSHEQSPQTEQTQLTWEGAWDKDQAMAVLMSLITP